MTDKPKEKLYDEFMRLREENGTLDAENVILCAENQELWNDNKGLEKELDKAGRSLLKYMLGALLVGLLVGGGFVGVISLR